jgi:hypothetical protein
MTVRQPTPQAHGANARTDERKNMTTSNEAASRHEPIHWHRQSCWVTPQINLTGDLHESPTRALDQLDGWVTIGVTDIIDVRIEGTDEAFVADHAPDVNYIWLGVDDHGGSQPDEWFDRGVEAALAALADPDRRIVVHCHMGVNRGPSMGFAILLALGWDPFEALDAIRAARPIARVLYADDAISWWLRRNGASAADVSAGISAVQRWHYDNPHDTSWVISRIRLGGPLPGGN